MKLIEDKTNRGTGWVKYNIPSDVLIPTRMHLTENR